MKALVIAPQPFFSPRGTPLSVYYRTLVSAEKNINIDLLTYGEGTDIDIPNVRIIRIPRFSFLGNVKIGPSYLKLFLDGFIILWTIYLLIRNRYHFVHAHEEAIFFLVFLKPIFRFKLIYDMHSSLPQQLTNFQFSKSVFLMRMFKKLEDKGLHDADAIITICPDLADYVNGIVRDQEKHLLIENSIFDPVKLKRGDRKTGRDGQDKQPCMQPVAIPKGKRLIVYAGTLEPYQGIDILINAFKLVIEEIPSAYLLIVGGSKDQVELFSRLAEEQGVDRYTMFTGRVSQSLAKHYCSLASVQMSPRSNGTNTPLKIYEQLASRVPVVATNIYSHTQVLNSDVAFLVSPEPVDMAKGISAALQDWDRVKKMVTNAERLYRDNYSRPIYENKMQKILKLVE
jgi:glycosyltransferase involved in cell wall biosynthesis